MQEKNPIPLDDLGKKIVEGVKKDGIFVTHIDEVFPNEDWFPKLLEYAKSLESTAQVSAKKSFFNDMWDMNNLLLDLNNPFIQFTLHDKLLGIANAYLGLFSRLHSLRLMKTITVPEGKTPEQSQLWHRDNGDKRYLKIFLYLNDVEEKTGPFMYVKNSQPGGRWNHLFPQIIPYSPKSARISDEDVASVIPKEDIVVCTGRAGTMAFVDTTGIHKGGYSTEGERFTSLATFFSKSSLTKVKKRRKFIFPGNFEENLKTLSPQAAYAIKKM